MAPTHQTYMKPIPSSAKNSITDHKESKSKDERQIHQGNKKIISISNKINNIAIM